MDQEVQVKHGDCYFQKVNQPLVGDRVVVMHVPRRTEPVSIPLGRKPTETEEDDDGEEMVAPHVVVERRWAGKTGVSMCSGRGRTLKGRDLSQLRNSVLRMTGFLEG